MEKAHSRIKWENYPSIATPLNETNLNKMDVALDEVDNRVLGLDTAKLDKSVANTMVKDISFAENTGIFTITLLNGTKKTIDTKLEKIATNFSYDNQTQKLNLTLVDGTKQEIDLSSLISQIEFIDSETIDFSIDSTGKVSAIVKDGTITEDKLQPNFLADVKVEVAKAKSSSDSAYENATTARESATAAQQFRNEAEQFRNEAEAISGVSIATTEKAGLVKPDGETIRVDPDGTIHADRGTTSYTDLENKPTINNVELTGNKTIDDLGGLTAESTVSFSQAAERTNIEATDNVKGIFGKVKKFFADLKPHAFSNPTNNLLATEPGTPLDAVQGKVLYEKIRTVNVSRNNSRQYNTLEEFVTDTATDITIPHFFRFKDLGGFVFGKANSWYRILLCYQNPYSETTSNSLGGTGLLWDASNVYRVFIGGTKTTGISLTLEKLVTETELNSSLTNKVDKIFIDTATNRYFEFTAKPAIAYFIVVRSTGTSGANGMAPVVFIIEMNRDLATYRATLVHGSALPTISLTNGVFNINTGSTYTRASIMEMY